MKKRKKKKIMKDTKSYVVEIPLKLPSCNNYINACRYNRYAGAKMKKDIQNSIAPYLMELPKLHKVKIGFTWQEGNKRRDLDGICFGKKFILDTLVELGKLKDDNRNNVCAFTDSFTYGDSWKVTLVIQEVEDDSN
jgi:Holliday junction resolvase RusA-like endonuclease